MRQLGGDALPESQKVRQTQQMEKPDLRGADDGWRLLSLFKVVLHVFYTLED